MSTKRFGIQVFIVLALAFSLMGSLMALEVVQGPSFDNQTIRVNLYGQNTTLSFG